MCGPQDKSGQRPEAWVPCHRVGNRGGHRPRERLLPVTWCLSTARETHSLHSSQHGAWRFGGTFTSDCSSSGTSGCAFSGPGFPCPPTCIPLCGAGLAVVGSEPAATPCCGRASMPPPHTHTLHRSLGGQWPWLIPPAAWNANWQGAAGHHGACEHSAEGFTARVLHR